MYEDHDKPLVMTRVSSNHSEGITNYLYQFTKVKRLITP